MKKGLKVLLFIIMIMILSFGVGCGNKDHVEPELNSNESDMYTELGLEEDQSLEIEEGIEENLTNEQDNGLEVISEEVIPESSSVLIKNFLQDGTFWAEERNEQGEEYIIYADINKNVFKRVSCDMYEGSMLCGIDDDEIAIWSHDSSGEDYIYIWNVNSYEDCTKKYIGDNDIINQVLYEKDILFLETRHIESFEEEYDYYSMVDINGNVIFELSLEEEKLLNDYGINRWNGLHIHTEKLADNIYCVEYIGNFYEEEEPNALVVDLERNKIIPITYSTSSGSVRSDGNYTYIGWLRINNETGEIEKTTGEVLSQDRLLDLEWSDERYYVIKDLKGNVVKKITNEKRPVQSVSIVEEGVALVVFDDNYFTLIDSDGEFLFEPIKGRLCHGWGSIYDECGLLVAEDVESNDVFTIDKVGNKRTLDLAGDHLVYYATCEGKKYWVRDGKGMDSVRE